MLTRIVTFYVKPERQRRIAEILGHALEKHVRSMSGFLNAEILLSDDGRQVVNLARWKDESSWLVMEADAQFGDAVSEAFDLADRTTLLSYRIAHSIESKTK